MIALATAMVLLAIAGLHAAWALRATCPAADEAALPRMPSAAACRAVVAALAGIALLVLAKGGWLADPLPSLSTALLAASAALFASRGVAVWLTAWRRLSPEEPFATPDRRHYGPFCHLPGAGQVVVLI